MNQIPQYLCAYVTYVDYMDPKYSAALLAVKKLVGVAPEVNLENPLFTDDKARKRKIHPDF